MIRSSCAALVVALVFQAGAQAQEAGAAPRLGTPADSISELKAQVADLEKRLAAIESTTLPAINASLMKILDRLEALDRDDLPAISKDVSAVNDKLQQVAESDGSRFVPSILGNMQKSDKFREQLVTATQGALLVNNATSFTHTLHVNGAAWQIPPGDGWTIPVQLGAVTTQLYPYEATKQWSANQFKLTADRYELKLVIGY